MVVSTRTRSVVTSAWAMLGPVWAEWPHDKYIATMIAYYSYVNNWGLIL
jgi:hypothetical protein